MGLPRYRWLRWNKLVPFPCRLFFLGSRMGHGTHFTNGTTRLVTGIKDSHAHNTKPTL